MQRVFLLLLFLSVSPGGFATHISGKVTDIHNLAVPFALVFVKGSTHGTTTNEEGNYFLDLETGEYEISFQLISFLPLEKKITVLQKEVELNVQLHASPLFLKEFKVLAGDEDPAYAVIRAAQKKRKFHLDQVNSYTCNVFIKGVSHITKYPKKIAGIRVSIEGLIDTTSGIVFLSESESKYYFRQPDKVHEEMIASKTSGKPNGFSYNRASDLDFNFYKAVMKNPGISERGFISPIAPNALHFYRYKLMGTFYENKEMINKVSVVPKRKSGGLFSGFIYIVENSWRIHSTDLMLDKNTGIQWVDTLLIRQEYLKVNDSVWMPFKNNFEYKYAGFGGRGTGVYSGVYSNYTINPELPARLFKMEAITFNKNALKRDSSYWNNNRMIPLTSTERKDYRQRDSLSVIHSSVKYIDSLERANNTFKWNDVVDGYTFKSELRKCEIAFEPMYDNISFNAVQGVVLTPTVSFLKYIAPTKNYELGGTAGYGFSNKNYYGYGHLSYSYNTHTFSKLTLSGGKDMLQFNSNAISPLVNTIYTLLLKDNFMKLFEKYYTRIEHSTELINGLILFSAVEYADRIPLRNTTNFSFVKPNKEFQSNDPQVPDNDQFAFARNQSFHLEGALQFTPFQRYYFNGSEKLIEESKFPTFTLFYKRAIKGIMKSDVGLELIKAGIKGDIHWLRSGTFHYLLEGGRFVNRDEMTFMDWKYFNGNKTLYSNFSGKQFQLLDYYTNSTNNEYAELHLQQNFNGMLLNKVPLLKKAKIREIVSANFLITGNNFHYEEFGVGLQKMFVRVDYVFGFTKGVYSDSSLRFGFLF